MRALTLALALCAAPASAQSLLDQAAGTYGSATDPAQSCATNPHELSFITDPPHAFFRWTKPRPDLNGNLTDRARYDMIDIAEGTISLRFEGPEPPTADGQRPTWLLRFTQNPPGYCLGRTDWSPVRCVEPAIRCDSPTS